jgi:hypothetical protein
VFCTTVEVELWLIFSLCMQICNLGPVNQSQLHCWESKCHITLVNVICTGQIPNSISSLSLSVSPLPKSIHLSSGGSSPIVICVLLVPHMPLAPQFQAPLPGWQVPELPGPEQHYSWSLVHQIADYGFCCDAENVKKTSSLIGSAREVFQEHAEVIDHGIIVGHIVSSHTQNLHEKVSICCHSLKKITDLVTNAKDF